MKVQLKEKEKLIYNMQYRTARAKQKTRQDSGNRRVIRNVNGNIEQDEGIIKVSWREYFEELLNTENERGNYQKQEEESETRKE